MSNPNPNIINSTGPIILSSLRNLDENVVHKSGDEIISGKKIFSNDIEIGSLINVPTIYSSYIYYSSMIGSSVETSLIKKLGTTDKYFNILNLTNNSIFSGSIIINTSYTKVPLETIINLSNISNSSISYDVVN